MKNLKNFESFLNENEDTILTPKEVISYITEITPEDSDVPDYFFELIKKNGKNFKRMEVNIPELLKKDPALKEYVDSGEVRYGENGESDIEPDDDDLNNPIVILKGEVIDGYNRIAVHHRNGDETITAYVSQ